eukprot:COSAG02_NODE_577_length_20095_cov_6.816413_24_plen_68_part_00
MGGGCGPAGSPIASDLHPPLLAPFRSAAAAQRSLQRSEPRRPPPPSRSSVRPQRRLCTIPWNLNTFY